MAGSFASRSGIHLNFWWRTLDQANQGIDGIIITLLFGKRGTKPNMNPNPISSLISSCLFCSLFYFLVPRASFPYFPFPVLVKLFPFTWSASMRIWNIKEYIYKIKNLTPTGIDGDTYLAAFLLFNFVDVMYIFAL